MELTVTVRTSKVGKHTQRSHKQNWTGIHKSKHLKKLKVSAKKNCTLKSITYNHWSMNTINEGFDKVHDNIGMF